MLGLENETVWRERRLEVSIRADHFSETLETESWPRSNTVLELDQLMTQLAAMSPVVEVLPVAYGYIYGLLNSDQVFVPLQAITTSTQYTRQAILLAENIYSILSSKHPE